MMNNQGLEEEKLFLLEFIVILIICSASFLSQIQKQMIDALALFQHTTLKKIADFLAQEPQQSLLVTAVFQHE